MSLSLFFEIRSWSELIQACNFAYDESANFIAFTSPRIPIQACPSWFIEHQDFTYAYDLNGNLVTKITKAGGAVTDYTWDAEDRLARIDFPDLTFAEYRYDGIGRRIEKDANGTVTRYVYDGANILLEYDGTNFLLARYTHGPGIDDAVMVERDGDSSGTFEAAERFFYQTDGLGSVTELTDSTGAVARTLVYDSYGQIAQDTGGVDSPFAFTGRELDSESGLYFYRARYYDAATGRFLAEDPLGFAAGDENLYRYVFNSPVNFRDPLGSEALTFGDTVSGSLNKASKNELILAAAVTFSPVALAALAPCAVGAGTGAFGGAFGGIFGELGQGAAEQERRTRSRDCDESGDGAQSDGPANPTALQDVFASIGENALLGCVSGGLSGKFAPGSSLGVAATLGAALGFIKGFTGVETVGP